MRLRLLILGTLFSVTSYSQVQTGTYELRSDPVRQMGAWIYARLHINSDKTFRIENRTGGSCFLWKDIYGTWTVNGSQLVLEDVVFSSGADNEAIKRTTTYLISNSELVFQERRTSKPALLQDNGLFGDYRKTNITAYTKRKVK